MLSTPFEQNMMCSLKVSLQQYNRRMYVINNITMTYTVQPNVTFIIEEAEKKNGNNLEPT